MIEPNLSDVPLGAELMAAATTGPDAARRVARQIRRAVGDDVADAVGERLASLLELHLDEPGRIGPLVAAAPVLAGPRTLAQAGRALRGHVDGSEWAIELGLDILESSHRVEAVVQLMLCSRDASEVTVLKRAASAYRGFPSAMRELLSATRAETPHADLERYFALALERAMVQGTRYAARDLAAALKRPSRQFLGRVVWAHYDGRRPVELFIADPDGGGFIDSEFDVVKLSKDARVGVVHPADLTAPLRDEWGLLLADVELVGLFSQFDRVCLHAAPDFRYDRIARDVLEEDLVRFLYQADSWHPGRGSRSFDLDIRGSVLRLHTRRAGSDLRRVESFSLNRPILGRDGPEDDIVFSESLAAAVRVLDEFAPELI